MPKSGHRKNIVGVRVAEARQQFTPSLTQDELSGKLARIGVQLDRAAIAKIERGYRHVFDYEIKGFAEVLNVKVDWLLGRGAK